MTTYPFFCGKDCGGNACPLLATVEGGRVTRIVHNPAAGEDIKGCWRGYHMNAQYDAPGRILTPLIRTGARGSGQFRAASWDEALEMTAHALETARAEHGVNSVLRLSSAGSTGTLHGSWELLTRFLNLFGGCTHLTSNYSNGAANFVLPYLLGDQANQSGFDAATMQYAEMIVLWGANILDTRLGAEVPHRLMDAKRRGAQIVVIDPRRTNTVKQAATWWLPCRPGTDAALMLAVLHVLLSQDLVDQAFVEAHSTGFDALARYTLGLDGGEARNPQWAEAICGLPAQEITRFALAYAAAKPAMLLPGYSIQRVFAGEETYRLAVALQIATGNFGQRGGSTGSLNNTLPVPRVGSLPIPKIPNQPGVPVVHWPDLVLQGRGGGYPSDIHVIYSLGANYLNQGADVRKSIAAFEHVDFAVCHELYLTPTAQYCDVIFPAASPFEKEDIGQPWGGNYLLYKPQILPPPGEVRNDYEILCALAERLGFLEAFSEGRSAAQWIEHFLDQSEINDRAAFRQSGVYLAPDQERVGLADFAANPLEHPLSTPSGKVEIASAAYQQVTGFPAIPTWQAAPVDDGYPLRLITPKSAFRTHSQGGNSPAIRAKDPHYLEMHPQDAAPRDIQEGDAVRLWNAQGTGRVTVHLSEDIALGVVSLLEGQWAALGVDGVDAGGSTNLYSSTVGTRPGHANIMNAVPVQVAREA